MQFKTQVTNLLSQARKAKYTDINGALARFALFFKEPKSQQHDKMLIFISDGIHTGWRNKYLKATLPNDVQVLTVGMSPQKANQLFGQSALLFENIEAAIEYLKNYNNQ